MEIDHHKPMIQMSTDTTNLSTDCIGISSTPRVKKVRGRGRPKGSKSKNKKSGRKRTVIQSLHTEYNTLSDSPNEFSSNVYASHFINNRNYNHNHHNSSQPRRKKRKPNKAHRDAFPNATDEDIRKQLAEERKKKNRKSAQESRERRKKQEAYLNDRLPKGLQLKELLQSNIQKTHVNSETIDIDYENESLESCIAKDVELSQMVDILTQMCDNQATEYDQYSQIHREKSEIADELIIEILNEYMNGNHSETDSDNNKHNHNHNPNEMALETDTDPIHLQVIAEIQNGVPMEVDNIPESATPNALRATRGRKAKSSKSRNRIRLKTPPTIGYDYCSVNETELPPPVFGADDIDFNIVPESAVSSYPVPQDSMLNQYHFPSLYSQSNPPCIIKHEKVMTQFPKFPIHHTYPLQNQTPSTISTNSTISNHSEAMIKREEDMNININLKDKATDAELEMASIQTHVQMNERLLMTLVPTTIAKLPCHYPHNHPPLPMIAPIVVPIVAPIHRIAATAPIHVHLSKSQLSPQSPMYTTTPMAPCLHTPEQMHFIHPLPARVPLISQQPPISPIIRHSTQQDIKETKQMLMQHMDNIIPLPDMAIHMDMQPQVQQVQVQQQPINTNNGKSGKNFKNGNNLNNTKNGERDKEQQQQQQQQEMGILRVLVEIVQTFIIIICGMAMIQNIQQMKQQYMQKISKASEDLRVLVLRFMRHKITMTMKTDQIMEMEMEMEMEMNIIVKYIPEMIHLMRQHPLIPKTQTMDVSCHYQAYRQIAMEILQNMKQQAIYYQNHMQIQVKPHKQKQNGIINKMDLNLKSQPLHQSVQCLEGSPMDQITCLQKSQMKQKMNCLQIHSNSNQSEMKINIQKYKELLPDKCFKILSHQNG